MKHNSKYMLVHRISNAYVILAVLYDPGISESVNKTVYWVESLEKH
jgi:hypothetical protein